MEMNSFEEAVKLGVDEVTIKDQENIQIDPALKIIQNRLYFLTQFEII